MHLLSCKGRDSKPYHADGDYCTVPPRKCSRCSRCSAERHFPAPAALLVLDTDSALAAILLLHGQHSRALMSETSLPNTARLTLSPGTAWSVSAACHFATNASFSYSRASKMFSERREISLHVFFSVPSRNQHPFSYLKYSVAVFCYCCFH